MLMKILLPVFKNPSLRLALPIRRTSMFFTPNSVCFHFMSVVVIKYI